MIVSSIISAGLQSTTTRIKSPEQVGTVNKKAGFSEVLGTRAESAQTQFEGLVESKLSGVLLGNVFQLMVPKQSAAVFGDSSTAGMWNSFIADALADTVNASGKIDLRLVRF